MQGNGVLISISTPHRSLFPVKPWPETGNKFGITDEANKEGVDLSPRGFIGGVCGCYHITIAKVRGRKGPDIRSYVRESA